MNPPSRDASARLSPVLLAGCFVLFFASGASGLIYEVIWTRQLLYVFGAAQKAVATVLAAFMGGLALGSMIGGPLADRSRRPLRLYGMVEIGVGLAALALPLLLGALDPLFRATYRALGYDSSIYAAARFLYVFTILLIPTTFMGATLPLLSRFVARSGRTLGSRLGALYTVNTAGAVAGVFGAGFVLIAAIGVRHTTWLAVGVNVVVGALAIAMARLVGEQPPAEEFPKSAKDAESAADAKSPEAAAANGASNGRSKTLLRWVLFSYGLSGAAALAYQVVWTRSLVFSFDVMKNTTYAFSGMLAVFLVGLALGSAIMTLAIDRQRDPLRLYALLQALIGIAGALSFFLIHFVAPKWSYFPETGADGKIFWVGAIANLMLKTAACIGLPTLLMGMAFPAVVRVAVSLRRGVGADVGRLYAANTIGAIIGSFAAGFVLIPWLGVTSTLTLLACLQVLMGAALLWMHPGLSLGARRAFVVGAVAAFAIVFVRIGMTGLSVPLQGLTPHERLVYYNEGPLSTVSIVESRATRYRTIFVDNVGVAGTDRILLTDQKSLAHVPMLLVRDPKAALTVGFGSGGASYSYTTYDCLDEVHCVEIDPAVLLPAPLLMASNHGILFPNRILPLGDGTRIDFRDAELFTRRPMNAPPIRGFRSFDPRYKVVLEDARSYLHFTRNTYDIIATDCTDLRYKTNANLYDLNYFSLCRDRLRPGGMVVVWMPLGGLTETAFLCALRTFNMVFPHMTVWYFNNEPTHYILLLGTLEPQRYDYAQIKRRLEESDVRADLAELDLADPAKILSCYVTNETALATELDKRIPLNTEDTPYLEFESPKYGYGDAPLQHNMGLLYQAIAPVRLLVDNASSETLARINRLQYAAPTVFQGHCDYRLFKFRESAAGYMKALDAAGEGGDAATRALLNFPELAATAQYFRELDAQTHPEEWLSGMWLTFHRASTLALQRRWSDAVTALSPLASLAESLAERPAPASEQAAASAADSSKQQGAKSLDEDLRHLAGRAEALRAYCYVSAGRNDQARPIIERARRLFPKSADIQEIEIRIKKSAPLPDKLP